MAGGYITRTVRGGIYDEQCDVNGKAHGYYAFAKRLKNMDEKELEKENDSLFLNYGFKHHPPKRNNRVLRIRQSR